MKTENSVFQHLSSISRIAASLLIVELEQGTMTMPYTDKEVDDLVAKALYIHLEILKCAEKCAGVEDDA